LNAQGISDRVGAAAFRRLLDHLRQRSDVQNVDLMGTSGFCRNCLADWVAEASAENGQPIDRESARELIYGVPYAQWRTEHQLEATPEQMERMAQSVARNRERP
jgi:hypothetical protein